MKAAVFTVLLLTLFSSAVMAEDQTIADGKTVSINYTLSVDGKVVDQSPAEKPLQYVQGSKDLIPSLQEQLIGMKAGDKKEVVLSPEKAFGSVREDAILEVPKSNLPQEDLQVGMVLASQTPEGEIVRATVKELKEESAMLDFNHPLAGKELHFDVQIQEVSDVPPPAPDAPAGPAVPATPAA
jgi:FKBP-type peptidyl-prolyl cis-trans isomerase SlyD